LFVEAELESSMALMREASASSASGRTSEARSLPGLTRDVAGAAAASGSRATA
jgi:hypothetical protein